VSQEENENPRRMKLAELEPGIYKVKINKGDSIIKPDKTEPRPTAHLLFVKGSGEQKTYRLDNELAQTKKYFVADESEFEVIRKITQVSINRQRIHLTWKDEDGDSYLFSTTDAWALKAMFEEFKFLADQFNFRPQRKRKLD